MTTDELINLDYMNTTLSQEEIASAVRIYTEDADNEGTLVRSFLRLCSNLSYHGDVKAIHTLHTLTRKYIANLESKPGTEPYDLAVLYTREFHYFISINAYAEALRNMNRVLQMSESLPGNAMVVSLSGILALLIDTKMYDHLPRYIERLESYLSDDTLLPDVLFAAYCNLMYSYSVLSNREKSDYYYNLVRALNDRYPNEKYAFIEIYKLHEEAELNKGTVPSSDYLRRFNQISKFIYPGNFFEETYSNFFISIIDYVYDYTLSSELIDLCLRLIGNALYIPDKLILYRYMIKRFKMTPAEYPNIFREYYFLLEKQSDELFESRVHELTNEFLNMELTEKYEKAASVDVLTGLGNRYAYEKKIEELSSAEEVPSNLFIVMMDLNGLKGVNDNYGHDAGDTFIKGAGNCILSAFTRKNFVFRPGGDEFMAIVRASADSFAKMLEKLDSNIEKWNEEHEYTLSISIGSASTYDADGTEGQTPRETIDKLARLADQRMYEAKKAYYERTGKNRRK